MSLETVRVRGWATDGSHDGGVIINKSDFDPEKRELFDVPKSAETTGSSFLKGTTAQITAALPNVPVEELQGHLDAEKASARPRTGVVSAIEAEIVARFLR
jgi:hypothetical protein